MGDLLKWWIFLFLQVLTISYGSLLEIMHYDCPESEFQRADGFELNTRKYHRRKKSSLGKRSWSQIALQWERKEFSLILKTVKKTFIDCIPCTPHISCLLSVLPVAVVPHDLCTMGRMGWSGKCGLVGLIDERVGNSREHGLEKEILRNVGPRENPFLGKAFMISVKMCLHKNVCKNRRAQGFSSHLKIIFIFESVVNQY